MGEVVAVIFEECVYIIIPINFEDNLTGFTFKSKKVSKNCTILKSEQSPCWGVRLYAVLNLWHYTAVNF